MSAGVVILRNKTDVQRLSVRLFQSSKDIDQLSQALMVRTLGESSVENLHELFSQLFAQAPPAGQGGSCSAPPSRVDAERDARLDAELEKLD